MTKTRKQLTQGDVVLDVTGAPYYRVERVQQARARGYVVVSMFNLRTQRDDQTSGHGADVLTVQD